MLDATRPQQSSKLFRFLNVAGIVHVPGLQVTLLSHPTCVAVLGMGRVNRLHFIPTQGLQLPPFSVQGHEGTIHGSVDAPRMLFQSLLPFFQSLPVFGNLFPLFFPLSLCLSIPFSMLAHRVITHSKQQKTFCQFAGLFKRSFHAQDP